MPVYGLRLRTERLELRWPDAEELAVLARVAERGVHGPQEMPFMVPWTDGIGTPGFVEEFVNFHLTVRGRWRREDWDLQLGVWAAGEPIGVQAILGRDFDRTRAVKSGSWLVSDVHGRGYGTEMRAAVLELAFHGLGATVAETAALDGAEASARVSEKLGYTHDGDEWVVVRGDRRLDRHMSLSRERWLDQRRISVRISGLEPCLPLFGVKGSPERWIPSC